MTNSSVDMVIDKNKKDGSNDDNPLLVIEGTSSTLIVSHCVFTGIHLLKGDHNQTKADSHMEEKDHPLEDDKSQQSDFNSLYEYTTDSISVKSARRKKKTFLQIIGLRKRPDIVNEGNNIVLSGDEEDEEVDEDDYISSDDQHTSTAPVQPTISTPQPSTTKSNYKYSHLEFSRLVLAQTLNTVTKHDMSTCKQHTIEPIVEPSSNSPYGAIWTSRFSKDGRYLATAGQSCVIFVWKLSGRTEHPTKVLDDTPHEEYCGHTADILDVAWSKNNFLLSSSLDKTVRLWHISQKECLCAFNHLQCVTSVEFHPKDDRYFLSGSLDGRVRVWCIPEKKVAFWNELPGDKCVTAVGFTLDGRTIIAGSGDGHCYFFETQGLKYITQVAVTDSAKANSNTSKKGAKITGIEMMPGMPPGEEKMLVTSNDSIMRLFNMKDKSLIFKYKGASNTSMQIRATFSDDGRYIISGSDDNQVYIWHTEQSTGSTLHPLNDPTNLTTSAAGMHSQSSTGLTKWLKRRQVKDNRKMRIRAESFETHDYPVTTAIFAPCKTYQLIAKLKQDTMHNTHYYKSAFEENNLYGHIIVTTDFRGIIKLWHVDPSDKSEVVLTEAIAGNSSGSKSTPSPPKVRRNFGLFKK
ncbi:WD40-repeat-containing domain protein [Pilobolus umbonatus]|nr:WD40-repeat-containing domain protein [Pilobolus umbonatus]